MSAREVRRLENTWHLRLKAVFDDARRLDAARRDALLERINGESADGPAVAEAVRAMLKAVTPIDADVAQDDHFDGLQPPRLSRDCRP